MQHLQDLVDGWFAEAGGGPLLPRSAGELRQDGSTVASRPLPVMDMYAFKRALLRELTSPGEHGFALSFGGHGANSYAWTLWHSRPNLRFCVQVHGGGAYARSESTAREMAGLVELYEQSLLLSQAVQGDLVVIGSTFRGGLRVVEAVSPFEAAPLDQAGRAPIPALSEVAAAHDLPAGYVSPRWVQLRRKLTTSIEDVLQLQSSDILPVSAERYLQWAAWPEGLQVEASSNLFLEEERLGFATRRGLALHEWNRPQAPDLPNFWRRFDAPVDVDAAVDALLSAARVLAPEPEPESEPTTAPSVSPQEPTPAGCGRRFLLVPVLKCGYDFLASVADDLAFGTPDVDEAVVYLDLAGALLSEERLALPYARVLTAPPPEAGELRLVDGTPLVGDRGVPALLAAAGDLLQTVEALSRQGTHVVVVGPRLLPTRGLNAYRALAGGGFDVVVVLVDGSGPDEISLEADLITELLGCTWLGEGSPVVVAGAVPPAMEWPGELPPRVVTVVPWATRDRSTSRDMPWLSEVWRRAHAAHS